MKYRLPMFQNDRVVVPGLARQRIGEDPPSRKKGVFHRGLDFLLCRIQKLDLPHSGLRLRLLGHISDDCQSET